MENEICEVLEDFVGPGGINIKHGTRGKIVKCEVGFLWVDAYIDDIDDEAIVPVLTDNIKIVEQR